MLWFGTMASWGNDRSVDMVVANSSHYGSLGE